MSGNIKYFSILILQIFFTPTIFAEFKFFGLDGSMNIDKPTSSLILDENIIAFNGQLKCATTMSDNIKSNNGTETITFITGGSIQLEGSKFEIQGNYDPKISAGSNDKITLNNGDMLNMVAGKIVSQDIVVGSGATAKISGTPAFGGLVTLADATTTLDLELFDRLEKNINLNGGTVRMYDNLKFKEGFGFASAGSVDLGGNILNLSGTWNADLEFKNSGTIELAGPTTSTGNWNFSDIAGSTIIQGNGHTLNLNGGTLQVAANHELILTDLRLQGLGQGGLLNLFDSATTPGKIIFRNVCIELGANYILTAGIILFDGGLSKIVGPAAATLKADGINTKFIINRVVVYFESLSGNSTNPFTVSNEGTIDLQNGGKIRAGIANTLFADFILNADIHNNQTINEFKSRKLHLNSRVVVTNIGAPATKIITVDGNDSVWTFPAGTTKVIVIEDAVTVILKNLMLKNFSLDAVQVGANSKLLLGDGVTIDLEKQATLPKAGLNIEIVGNVVLRGHGQSLILNQAAALSLNGAAKKLVLNNISIYTKNLSAFICQNSTATITLKDCKLIIDESNFEFANGNLEIEGFCILKPINSTSCAGQTFFKFSSSGLIKINSGATLQLDNRLEFIYAANPILDLNNTAATKRHFIMTDPSATFFLNGCTLTSTTTAIALDKGNLIIDGKVILNASTNPGEAAELGTALTSKLLADANFLINGNVNFIPSSI